MARHRLLAALLRFESPDLLQQACLVGGDPFLDVVVQLQRGLKVEQMLLAPGAREIFGEVRLGFPAPLAALRSPSCTSFTTCSRNSFGYGFT